MNSHFASCCKNYNNTDHELPKIQENPFVLITCNEVDLLNLLQIFSHKECRESCQAVASKLNDQCIKFTSNPSFEETDLYKEFHKTVDCLNSSCSLLFDKTFFYYQLIHVQAAHVPLEIEQKTNFVIYYCQFLQKYLEVDDLSVLFILTCLKQSGFLQIRNSSLILCSMIEQATTYRIPLALVCSWSSILAVRFSPENALYPHIQDTQYALEVFTNYLNDFQQQYIPFFVDFYKVYEVHVGIDSVLNSSHLLTLDQTSMLQSIFEVFLNSPNIEVYKIGVQLALIPVDGARLPSKCRALPLLLKGGSVSKPALSFIYAELSCFYVKTIDNFRENSTEDWIDLLLTCFEHGQSRSELAEALAHLALYDKKAFSRSWISYRGDLDSSGVIKAWHLLNILLCKYFPKTKDAGSLINGVIDMFGLVDKMYRNGTPVDIRSRDLMFFLNMLSQQNDILNHVDPNTQTNCVSEVTAKKYKKTLIEIIVQRSGISENNKQQLLLNFILKNHLQFSDLSPCCLALCKPLVDNYSPHNLPEVEKSRWSFFKCQLLEFFAKPDGDRCPKHTPTIKEITEAFFGISENAPYYNIFDRLYKHLVDAKIISSTGCWMVKGDAFLPPLGKAQQERLQKLFCSKYVVGDPNVSRQTSLREFILSSGRTSVQLVGSAVMWILGENYFRSFLKNLGVPEELLVDELFASFRSLPMDFDLRFTATKAERFAISELPKNEKLFMLTKKFFETVNRLNSTRPTDGFAYKVALKKWAASLDEPTKLAMVAFQFYNKSPRKGEIKEFRGEFAVIYSQWREFLNTSDACRIIIPDLQLAGDLNYELRTDLSYIEEVFIHYLTRRLDTENSETIDLRGYLTSLVRTVKGRYPISETYFDEMHNRFKATNATYESSFVDHVTRAIKSHCLEQEGAFLAVACNAALFIDPRLGEKLLEVTPQVSFDESSFVSHLYRSIQKVEKCDVALVQALISVSAYLGWGRKVSVHKKDPGNTVELCAYESRELLSFLVPDGIARSVAYLVQTNCWEAVDALLKGVISQGCLGGLPLPLTSYIDIQILLQVSHTVAHKLGFLLLVKLNDHEISKNSLSKLYLSLRSILSPEELVAYDAIASYYSLEILSGTGMDLENKKSVGDKTEVLQRRRKKKKKKNCKVRKSFDHFSVNIPDKFPSTKNCQNPLEVLSSIVVEKEKSFAVPSGYENSNPFNEIPAPVGVKRFSEIKVKEELVSNDVQEGEEAHFNTSLERKESFQKTIELFQQKIKQEKSFKASKNLYFLTTKNLDKFFSKQVFQEFFCHFEGYELQRISLLELLEDGRIKNLFKDDPEVFFEYYIQLVDVVRLHLNQGKINFLCRFVELLSTIVPEGPLHTKGVEALVSSLGHAAGSQHLKALRKGESFKTHLTNLVAFLIKSGNIKTWFLLLCKIQIIGLDLSLRTDITETALDVIKNMPHTLVNDLFEIQKVYQFLILHYQSDMKPSRLQKDMPEFAEAFMSYNSLPQAIECVKKYIAPHDSANKLMQLLLDNKLLKEFEDLIDTSGFVLFKRKEQALLWISLAEAHMQNKLFYAVELYKKHADLLKEELTQEELNTCIFSLIASINKESLQDKKYQIFQVLQRFEIPPCQEWKAILKEISAEKAKNERKAEAWEQFKLTYADKPEQELRYTLLSRYVAAGFVEDDLLELLNEEVLQTSPYKPSNEKKMGEMCKLIFENGLKCSVRGVFDDLTMDKLVDFKNNHLPEVGISDIVEKYHRISQDGNAFSALSNFLIVAMRKARCSQDSLTANDVLECFFKYQEFLLNGQNSNVLIEEIIRAIQLYFPFSPSAHEEAWPADFKPHDLEEGKSIDKLHFLEEILFNKTLVSGSVPSKHVQSIRENKKTLTIKFVEEILNLNVTDASNRLKVMDMIERRLDSILGKKGVSREEFLEVYKKFVDFSNFIRNEPSKETPVFIRFRSLKEKMENGMHKKYKLQTFHMRTSSETAKIAGVFK